MQKFCTKVDRRAVFEITLCDAATELVASLDQHDLVSRHLVLRDELVGGVET